MRKLIPVLMICAAIGVFAVRPALAADEPTSAELKDESKRAKINEVAEETLEKLFAENANAKSLYDNAIGWAVFDNTKVAFGISGGGGNGVAVSKTSGKKAYMKMGTGGVGLGLGVNKYQIVFLFQDEKTLENFIEKGWQADAGATASAGTAAAEAKTNFVNGLAIYQLTEKGLMLNADIAGTKYWLNDKLNE
jgi:lipid-binding SYLF domain-containing protein